MPKIILDLSGRDGLAPRWYGDFPYSGTSQDNAANHQLRKYGTEYQLAKGTFNPISKLGYLSPANNTFKGSTNGTAAIMSATLVDSNTGFGFFFERGTTLHRTQTLTDTSFGVDVTISGSTGTDLEMYVVNGVQKLFFAHKTASGGDIGVWDISTLSGTSVNGTVGFLAYDTQTGNFTVGETITGAVSGGSGVVVGDRDDGTTGILMLRSVAGTAFVSGETITGTISGTAKTNGGFSSVKTNFMSTMPTGNATLGQNNLKMIVADNGLMYILDGSSIHKFDGTTSGGTTGTLTANVVTFPPYFQLTDGIDYRGKILAAITRSSRDLEAYLIAASTSTICNETCGVYVWDRKSSSSSMTDFIPISGAKETRFFFVIGGVPHLFTVSSDNYTQIREFTGNEFEVVEELSSDAFPLFRDSIQTSSDMITWQSIGGKIFSYGKFGGSTSNRLYQIGNVFSQIGSGKTFTRAGAMALMNSSETAGGGTNRTNSAYYLSWADTTPAYYFRKWYPHAIFPDGISQYPHEGAVYTLVKELPKLSKVISATLRFPPVSVIASADPSLYLDIYFNNSTTSWGRTTLTRADAVRGWKYLEIGKSSVNSIQAGITWGTAETTALSINPEYLEIVYEEEPRRK